MDLIKITPDREKARSILKMSFLLLERIKAQDKIKFASLIITDYYEVIKELITALLLTDGYKTLSHKDLIEYLNKKHSEFDENEIFVVDGLRILRNRIAYDGFFVEPSYLNRNEGNFKNIVKKLQVLIKNKI